MTTLPPERPRAAALAPRLLQRVLDRRAAGAAGARSRRCLPLAGGGHLDLSSTVFLTRDGTRTLGVVYACDHTGEPCLVTLDLRPGTLRRWRATVIGVVAASDPRGQLPHLGVGIQFDLLRPLRSRFTALTASA